MGAKKKPDNNSKDKSKAAGKSKGKGNEEAEPKSTPLKGAQKIEVWHILVCEPLRRLYKYINILLNH